MKKTIIITGVGKGFGKDLFEYFIRDYYVIGLTRTQEDIDALINLKRPTKSEFELFTCDVTDYKSLKFLLQDLLIKRSSTVYGLINNAGMRCRKSMLELSLAKIKAVCEVNLFAPINLTKILLPYFINNKAGRIINISSILSQSSLPDLSAYTISKAGLDGFTRGVTAEFASVGITCNSILPGFCKTSYFENFSQNEALYKMTIENTPAKRWGESGELIGLCELLLGDKGGYINGASIPVDGGWVAC